MPPIHDCSPGRIGDNEDFLWVDPITSMIVNGDTAKRCYAWFFFLGPGDAGEKASDDAQPRIRRRRSDRELPAFYYRTVWSVTDDTIFDDSASA